MHQDLLEKIIPQVKEIINAINVGIASRDAVYKYTTNNAHLEARNACYRYISDKQYITVLFGNEYFGNAHSLLFDLQGKFLSCLHHGYRRGEMKLSYIELERNSDGILQISGIY